VAQAESVVILQQRLAYEQKLVQLVDRIHAAKSIDSLFIELQGEILGLLDADRMTLYAVDPSKQELYSKFLALDTVKEIRVPVNEKSVAGFVAATIKLNTYVGQPLERVEEARMLYRARNPEVVGAHPSARSEGRPTRREECMIRFLVIFLAGALLAPSAAQSNPAFRTRSRIPPWSRPLRRRTGSIASSPCARSSLAPAAVTRAPGFQRTAHRSDAKQRRSSGQSVITGGDRALLFFWKASEVDLSGLIRVQKWPKRQGVHRRKHEDGRGSRHAVRRKDCPTQGTCREKVTGTDCYHLTTAGDTRRVLRWRGIKVPRCR